MPRLILGASVGWLGISMVADGVPALLLPYRLGSDGASDATSLGLVTLAAIGLAAVVQPFAGRWSDVVGRFPVIALGVTAAAVGLALLVLPGPPIVAMLGTVVALGGAGIAQAGQQALLPDFVERSTRGRGAGAKSAFDVGGAFLGFVILAALLGTGEADGAAAVLIGSLAGAALVGYLLLGRSSTPAVPASTPSFPSLRETFSIDVGQRGRLVRLIVARFLFLLGIYVVGRFLFLFVGVRFGLDAEATGQQAGAILAALALLTVAASLPAGWLSDRIGRRPVMLVGGVLTAVGVALVPTAGSVGLLLGTGVLIALGTAAFTVGSWALLTDLCAPRDTGRLLGLAHFGTAGAAAGAGAFGLVIDAGERLAPQAGYAVAFAAAAVCALAGGLLAWRLGAQSPSRAQGATQLEVKT